LLKISNCDIADRSAKIPGIAITTFAFLGTVEVSPVNTPIVSSGGS